VTVYCESWPWTRRWCRTRLLCSCRVSGKTWYRSRQNRWTAQLFPAASGTSALFNDQQSNQPHAQRRANSLQTSTYAHCTVLSRGKWSDVVTADS